MTTPTRLLLLALILGGVVAWAAIALAMTVRRRWRKLRAVQRIAAGHCPACGYDLAGAPGAAACPECGHVFDASERRRLRNIGGVLLRARKEE